MIMKISLKKVLVSAAMVLIALPSSFVYAAPSPTYTLIKNAFEADSADVAFDVDVTTFQEELDQPVTVHVGVNSKSDEDNHAQFDFEFWSTDPDGNFVQMGGSLIVTPEALYFSEDQDEWFVIELDDEDEEDLLSVEELPQEDPAVFEDFVNDLFDRGIITYELEGADVINRTMTARYAYQIDTDRLVDLLVEEGDVPEEEAQEIRDYLSENVTISGKFWVNVAEMLPVMLTLNVNVDPEGAAYTTVDASLFFRGFNEDVEVDIPENATPFEEEDIEETGELVATSLSSTFSAIDADGDGLTNEEEETWGSDPFAEDTDGDGYLDETEVVNGYNPDGTGKLDSDGDGLTDYSEVTVYGSNPSDTDSDNDGYLDGVEIANGYSPNHVGR